MSNAVIDLIIRLKNGYLAKKEMIVSPYSSLREEILKLLKKLGYIDDFSINKISSVKRELVVNLKYDEGRPVLTDVKIFSKPGQRIYVSYKKLKPVMGGLGYSILSTSKGLKTNKESKKEKIGGELLFNIW